MIPRRGARRITVDGLEFQWKRAHRHATSAAGGRSCVETVSVWLASRRGSGLLVRFVDGRSGGHTTAGEGYGGGDGLVLFKREWINLNRPAVTAALIRAARATGWNPARGKRRLIADGFAFIAAHPVPTGEGEQSAPLQG